MIAGSLQSRDLEVFSEAITHFFSTSTSERAEVRSAYLVEREDPVLWNDYNGLITVEGGYSGLIAFSAPRELLSHVLLRMGEQDFTEEKHHDIVGEIANILSGRARRHFGESLKISPPTALGGKRQSLASHKNGRAAAYAIPFRWLIYDADLVIRLGKR